MYIEVEPHRFKTDELIEEVIRRYNTPGRYGMTEKDKAMLLNGISNEMGGIPCRSLNDILKFDVLKNFWDSITPYQLEQKLKTQP